MKNQADHLREFAVHLYGREGVEDACLRMQERYGLSVSLLLSSIWTGLQGYGRLGSSELENSARRALEWHRDVIEPMRALRRLLRQQPPSGVEERSQELRRQLLEAELNAERIEQRLFLADFPKGMPVSPPEERWRDAVSNAALLMRKSCSRPEPEGLGELARVVHAACSATPYRDLYQEIEIAWSTSQEP